MIDLVEKQIQKFVEDLNSTSIENKVKQLPSGKRVRAKLVLKIAGVNEASIKLAAIIELIHGASLLHDDVIDEAKQRRGKSSINAIYGNKNAIMLGDILYSKAFYELSSFDTKISQIISNAVTLLSIGELEDVELSNSFNENEEKYNSMIYKKTASLIEATCGASALLANKNEKDYSSYGKNLGLAFQVIDDILDITSSQQTLGKPVMSDYVEGKTTLPFILLHQRLDKNSQYKLKSMFKQELSSHNETWIKEMLQQNNCLKDSKDIAKKLSVDAIKSVEDKELHSLVLNMVDREY